MFEHRAEWNSLVAQAQVATTEKALLAIEAQRDDCARRIFADPAARRDLRLLADATFWVVYGGDLAEADDALLATGATQGKACDEALAVLFRAVRDIA